ncbi:MAG: hypothetical protein FJ403_04485 [Verrucomicrobia bacterium]|nr:hypothetical protein [Verrucomicrobiota bacterium]
MQKPDQQGIEAKRFRSRARPSNSSVQQLAALAAISSLAVLAQERPISVEKEIEILVPAFIRSEDPFGPSARRDFDSEAVGLDITIMGRRTRHEMVGYGS